MADPFLAEIRIFGFNFPPTGWAFCDGQLIPISQNTALFALLGTAYGGDGKSTFALPDLQGAAPMHPDQDSGRSLHFQGEQGGSDNVTLLQSEMPLHTHTLGAALADAADRSVPRADATFGASGGANIYNPGPAAGALAPQTVATFGSSLPHNNLMPYLTLNFCIALQGIFPQRP